MLAIREKQDVAMETVMRERFTQRMIAHVKRHFASVTAELGDEATRQAVEDAWKLANQYRFETEYGVCQFINLIFTFGDALERAGWAAQILSQQNYPTEMARTDRLHAAALKTLGKPS